MYIPSPLYNNSNDKTQASSLVGIQHTGKIYDNGGCKGEGDHTSHSYPGYPGIFRFPHQLRKFDRRSNLTDRIPGFSGQLCHHEHSTTSGEDPEGNQGSRVAVAMPGDHSTPISENGGNPEFMYPGDNTSPTTLLQSAYRLEQGSSARRVQSPDLPITAIQGGATIMVPVFNNPQWETNQDTPSRPHHLYRHVSAWLGGN